MDPKQQLRNTVRTFRAQAELSQTELGDLVGVTRQTIAFIEKGEFAPSVALALKLSRVLGVPINTLFWLEKEA